MRDNATDAFLEIETAWRVLSDPQKRQEYDAELKGIIKIRYFLPFLTCLILIFAGLMDNSVAEIHI